MGTFAIILKQIRLFENYFALLPNWPKMKLVLVQIKIKKMASESSNNKSATLSMENEPSQWEKLQELYSKLEALLN